MTLEDYILEDWFEFIEEEEEEEEEVLYFCRMIVVDIDFQVRSIEITQDNRTWSNMIICAYNLDGNRAQLMAEIRGVDYQSDRLNMYTRLAYEYPGWVHQAR